MNAEKRFAHKQNQRLPNNTDARIKSMRLRTVPMAERRTFSRQRQIQKRQWLEFQKRVRQLAFSAEGREQKTTMTNFVRWIDRNLDIGGGSHEYSVKIELGKLAQKGRIKLPESTGRGGNRRKK